MRPDSRSKLKLPTATDSQDNDTIRPLQKSFSRQIAREHITLQLKPESKTPIRLIVQDAEKIPLTAWALNRIRAAYVHVKKLSDLRSPVTIVRIRMMWTFPNNTRNTVITHKSALKADPFYIVLHQSCPGSLHTNMTKAPMPEN